MVLKRVIQKRIDSVDIFCWIALSSVFIGLSSWWAVLFLLLWNFIMIKLNGPVLVYGQAWILIWLIILAGMFFKWGLRRWLERNQTEHVITFNYPLDKAAVSAVRSRWSEFYGEGKQWKKKP